MFDSYNYTLIFNVQKFCTLNTFSKPLASTNFQKYFMSTISKLAKQQCQISKLCKQ